MSDKDLNVNINVDEVQNLKKKYKKIKKYMRSGLYQIKKLDGTERVVSDLLKDDKTV